MALSPCIKKIRNEDWKCRTVLDSKAKLRITTVKGGQCRFLSMEGI